MRYVDESGKWKSIDLTMTKASDGTSGPTVDAHGAVLPAAADVGVSLWSPTGSFTLAHPDALHVVSSVGVDVATYPKAISGGDLVERPLVDGVEESLQVPSAKAGTVTRTYSRSRMASSRACGGGPGVEFVDPKGVLVATFGSGLCMTRPLGRTVSTVLRLACR